MGIIIKKKLNVCCVLLRFVFINLFFVCECYVVYEEFILDSKKEIITSTTRILHSLVNIFN